LLPAEEIEWATECLREGTDLRDYFDNVMLVGVSCIRGVLIPSEGKVINMSDLANIEGRYAAWTAEEAWKLEAFAEYDADLGPDLYVVAYARSFRVNPEEVTKEQRAIGKVQELMLQYQGGVGAFVTGAAGYGFDLEELADEVFDTLPDRQVAEANKYNTTNKQNRTK
jgi:DNA polymerase